jgi:arylsulfatase A-like enzyme
MATPRSLVLITVDCLRADHVGFLGYDRPTTPFLDALAEESFVIPTAIVAGAPTYYSFPAIMASRPPLALGRDVIGLAPGEPTLASALQQAGYATAAFAAGNPYLSQRFGYDTGFDTFHDFLNLEMADASNGPNGNGHARLRGRLNRSVAKFCHKLGATGSLYDELYFQYCQRLASQRSSVNALRRCPAADVVVDQARDWFGGIEQGPFFLWLHLMDPHAPYYPPAQAMAEMAVESVSPFRLRYLNSYWNRSDLTPNRLERHRDEIIALYDASIRRVDKQVARLVDALRHFCLWDNCILALTADHGEEFLEHGGRFHAPSKVTEEIVHVPLLLRVPEARMQPASHAPFSLLHLSPTLLSAAGVPTPDEFRGRSYWPEIQMGYGWEEEAIVECVTECTNPLHPADRLGPRLLAVRGTRYKLVLDFGARREQLFDLEADPLERQPLPEHAEKGVRRRLLQRALRHLAGAQQSQDADRRLAACLREIRQQENSFGSTHAA